MPRPGSMPTEKATNFSEAIKKVLKSMKKWHVIMIIAIIFAATGSIVALYAPNRMQDITNALQKGIVPDFEKFGEVMSEITSPFSDEKKMDQKSAEIMRLDSISDEDKQSFIEIMMSISELPEAEAKVKMLSIPDSIMVHLLEETTIDGIKITVKDELETLKISSSIDIENKEEALKKFNELPESIIDLVEPEMDFDLIKSITILLLTLYIISAVLEYLEHVMLSTVSNHFARELRGNISTKINRLPLKYFDSHEMGDVLSRVTNDVDAIAHHLNNSLATLVTAITQFVGSIIMMFYTNWIMAIAAILSSFIGFIGMGLILGKSQKYFNQKQEQLGKLNGHIEEIYSGHNVVKAYNGENTAREEFAKLNKDLYKSNQMSQFLSGLMPTIMGFIGNFGFVCVCVTGAVLVVNNKADIGVIVAFIIYVRLFTSPLNQIAQGTSGLQATAAASERVFEFLDEKEMSDQKEITKRLDSSKAKGEIEFKNVKFGYNKNKPIIKDFSVKVKPGQKIAIVGPTGAGKTTMVNLLMKFYEINDGEIIIDGISTKDLTRENIHKLFTMVLQDTWLFDGSVRDNIKFNRPNITDDEIWESLKVVGVDHFVKTLPGGLNATIDDGESISSGQKQLLTIARGMIEDAPFLILDEATSNVDTRTEELVQKAMDKLTTGRTSFIIAHRLSTIKNADLILVMKDGNIIEQGNHDELMKKKGFYADLYNSQFTKANS